MLLSDIVAVTTGAVGHTLAILRNMVTENVGNLRTCAQVKGQTDGQIRYMLGRYRLKTTAEPEHFPPQNTPKRFENTRVK
jgi:hypothetical protein